MMMRLAWRLLWRDWKAGELRILLLALVLAVSSMTTVGFFTDRIYRALQSQAHSLLGGDLVISADHDIKPAYLQYAGMFSLRVTGVTEFPTMAYTETGSQLVSVKAVEPGYPLRGHIKISAQAYTASHEADGIPAPGTVWAEARLLHEFGLHAGQMLALGQTQLKIAAVLVNDPTVATGGLFNLAHRLIMNAADLEATALVQPTSRVRYRLLFSGDINKINELNVFLKKRLKRGERLASIEDARPQIRSAFERARRFLNLAVLTCVMLAFMALATTSRSYLRKHLDGCAMMRCFGASHKTILRLFAWQLLFLGLLAAVLGCLAGYLLHAGLVRLFAPYISVALPAAGLRPVVTGIVTGLSGLLGFVMPSIIQLKDVPPLRVIRRELGNPRPVQLGIWLSGLLAFSALIIWQAGEWRLGLYMLGGFATTLALLLLSSLLLLRFVRLLRHRCRGGVWRLGLGALVRHPVASALQISAFGISVLVLMLLTLVRTDLLDTWHDKLPDNAPNRFLINIQPDQLVALTDFFIVRGQPSPIWMPMVRGRLVAINQQPVNPENYPEGRARHLVTREFNLSWTDHLQEDNTIVAGHWWRAGNKGRAVISVEEDLAGTLGIGVGDTLEFDIAGEPLSVQVMSLRKVRWDSFRANFFVLAAPGVLDSFPTSYITSFYLPVRQGQLLSELVKAFPNITVIDIDAIMSEVRSIIDRVSEAVEYVFVLTLISGFLVMFAAMQATMDERLHENALIRSLGGRRGQLSGALLVEFSLLGIVSGLIAAVCADAVGYIVARRLFQMEYVMDPVIWVAGMAGAAVVVAGTGWLGMRRVLRQPPALILRQLG